MRSFCDFCGRRIEDCKGGLWSRPTSAHAICVYCARAALRALDPEAFPGGHGVLPFPRADDPEPAA